MKLFGNKVLISPCKEQVSKKGIIIPLSAVDTRGQSLVRAVGPEVKSVDVGDRVIRDIKFPGQLIRFKGEDYFLLDEDGIMGIVLQ